MSINPNHVNPAPTEAVKGTQLTDRELIKALRDRVRPAAGDPVDVVDVRSDASDVVKFADIVGEIGTEAARAQQSKAELGEQLSDVAALRDLVESDALGALSPEESEDLTVRLSDFAARTGERILEPPPRLPQRVAWAMLWAASPRPAMANPQNRRRATSILWSTNDCRPHRAGCRTRAGRWLRKNARSWRAPIG